MKLAGIDCVYFISLEEYTDDYKAQVLERIAALRIPGKYGYHLFHAVNGLSIPNEIPHKPMEGWKIDPDSMEDSPQKNFWVRDITPGEIGCSLSHLMCWEDAHAEGHEKILILESDFCPKDEIEWNKIDSVDWDIFHLGRLKSDWYGEDTPIPGKNRIIRPGYSMNTHAYMLRRNAIESFVSSNFRLNLIASDEFLTSKYYAHPREDIRNLFPPDLKAAAYTHNNYPVTQRNNKSLTEPTKVEELKKLIQGPTYHGSGSPVEEAVVEEEAVFNPDQYEHVGAYIEGLRTFEFDRGFKPKNTLLYDYMYMSEEDKTKFQHEWLHPDFMMATQDPSGYGMEWGYIVEEPIKDVWCFPFLKKELCDMLIDEAEHFNHFLDEKSGSNARDNYPTTDVRLGAIPGTKDRNTSPIDEMYKDFLKKYIADVIKHFWRYSIKGIQQTFMARYRPSEQPGLNMHHDLCTCACLVRLNKDYDGGGTYFEKQRTLVDPGVGFATIHPSRLTHRHGGRQVTKGARYILVTFID